MESMVSTLNLMCTQKFMHICISMCVCRLVWGRMRLKCCDDGRDFVVVVFVVVLVMLKDGIYWIRCVFFRLHGVAVAKTSIRQAATLSIDLSPEKSVNISKFNTRRWHVENVQLSFARHSAHLCLEFYEKKKSDISFFFLIEKSFCYNSKKFNWSNHDDFDCCSELTLHIGSELNFIFRINISTLSKFFREKKKIQNLPTDLPLRRHKCVNQYNYHNINRIDHISFVCSILTFTRLNNARSLTLVKSLGRSTKIGMENFQYKICCRTQPKSIRIFGIQWFCHLHEPNR